MNLTTRVIKPKTLNTIEKKRLTQQFIKVAAAAAARGQDEAQVQAAWESNWGDGGLNLNSYDKFVIVEDEHLNVISFTGAKHLEIDGIPVFAGYSAYTLPKYQGTKISGLAWQHLIGIEDIQKFSGGYMVAQTPNPVAYESCNKMLGKMAEAFDLNAKLYPQIGEQGRVKPIPSEVAKIAAGALLHFAPNGAMDMQSLVIKESFKSQGDLFSEYKFNCRNKNVQSFFDNNLCAKDKDCLMMVISLDKKSQALIAA
jgi:hypothetical protein